MKNLYRVCLKSPFSLFCLPGKDKTPLKAAFRTKTEVYSSVGITSVFIPGRFEVFRFYRRKKTEKLKPNRYKTEAGMTLMEILVSLGIFTFMFVFIAQFTKRNYRLAQKMGKDSQAHYSSSHILDIMRRDFRGISYLLDVNHNLYAQFPIEEEESFEDEAQNAPPPQKKRKETPLFFSSQYLFEGSEDSMEFSSYSFIEKLEPEAPLAGWVRIHYSIEACVDEEKTGGSASCLIRSARRYWDSDSQEEEERKSLVLLRGFQSLRFFYADTEDFLDEEWRGEWEPERVSDEKAVFTDQVLELPFPSAVKIEGKQGNQRRDFIFPVSSFYLKTWNPATKAFPGFPEWKAPEKKKNQKNKRPSRPRGN